MYAELSNMSRDPDQPEYYLIKKEHVWLAFGSLMFDRTHLVLHPKKPGMYTIHEKHVRVMR